ncbi:MAG TPA: tripartite tricarboxylate transporter TctB family protein [Rhabdaerophilum sp.]|nr:tripartite tricarboxylate transporter TctB family protein [Rhabdaerophilum sp.]
MSTPSQTTRNSGRVAAAALILFALIYGYFGATVEYSFSSDPIGPRGFPLALAVVLAGFGIYYMLFPGEAEVWPEREGRNAALLFLGLSVLCVIGMDHIGFIPAMAVLMTGIARLFGANWPLALGSGIAQALVWWCLFGPVLGGNLPKGPLGF